MWDILPSNQPKEAGQILHFILGVLHSRGWKMQCIVFYFGQCFLACPWSLDAWRHYQCAMSLHLPRVHLLPSEARCFTEASRVLGSSYPPCSAIDGVDWCGVHSAGCLDGPYFFWLYYDSRRINIDLGQHCKCMWLSVPGECKLFLILFPDWDRKEIIGCIPFTQVH